MLWVKVNRVGEHHGGEQDCQNCHPDSGPGSCGTFAWSVPGIGRKIDCFFILFAPPYCATIRPSSMRITRSAMAAISGLWLIITMVLVKCLAGHFQKADHIVAGLGIQVAGRLIGQNDRGLGGQSTGNRHALLLASGEVTRQAV